MKKLRIKLVSDLHLEFSDIDIKNDNNYDVLVLSGDILVAEYMHDHPEPNTGPWSDDELSQLGHRQVSAQRFRMFLKRCSEQFPYVVYVAGNHEFYNGKWYDSLQYLQEECDKYSNIHFLERNWVDIEGVVFVGGTLWTDMNKGDPHTLHVIRDKMNDFTCIRNDLKGYTSLKPSDTVARHRLTLKHIREVITNLRTAAAGTRVVVVGHHTPSFKSCDPDYRVDTLMNGAYHSDLSEFILDHPEIVLWTCGHTHHAHQYHIGDTLIACNPRGYHSDRYAEETGFNPDILLEI